MQWSQQLGEISCMCTHSVLMVSWGFTEYYASPLEAEGAKICKTDPAFYFCIPSMVTVTTPWRLAQTAAHIH